jgi:hypothetical protein
MIEEDITGRLDRYLGCIFEREARILDSLATSSTLEELTLQKPITGGGGKPEQLFYQVEMIGIYNHLERLIAGGSVVRDGDYYVRA